jgi:hypothetical protein
MIRSVRLCGGDPKEHSLRAIPNYYCYSAQFRFSYAEQKAYWDQLLGENGFQIGD